MCASTAAPAEAFVPDADRAVPDASAHPPEWLVRWLALLVYFLLRGIALGTLQANLRLGERRWAVQIWPQTAKSGFQAGTRTSKTPRAITLTSSWSL